MTAARILVVDDEPGVRYFIEETLADGGYQVIAVDNGQAALDLITDQTFDLALLDLKMRGIGGLEVLAALRQKSPETTAIILTGHGSLETAIEALRQGAHDYLLKPCDPECLRQSVKSGLEGHKKALWQHESTKLISEITHQLRGSITSLGLNLELLEHDDPNKKERYLNSLKQTTTQMQSLVEDTLTLSRLEGTREHLVFTQENLNLLILQIVAVHQIQAEAIGLDLIFEPGKTLPPVYVARTQFIQAISNLVQNAIHYTPTGFVHLRSYIEPAAKNRTRSEAQAVICIEIKDTGIGIAPDELPHIFERFYRGKKAMNLDVHGSGLGLSIAKDIITMHHGTIEVKSQQGLGSTFTVRLPLKCRDKTDTADKDVCSGQSTRTVSA